MGKLPLLAGLLLTLTTSSASLRIAWLVLLWLNAMMRRMMVLNRMLRVTRLIEKLVVEILLLMIEFLLLSLFDQSIVLP